MKVENFFGRETQLWSIMDERFKFEKRWYNKVERFATALQTFTSSGKFFSLQTMRFIKTGDEGLLRKDSWNLKNDVQVEKIIELVVKGDLRKPARLCSAPLKTSLKVRIAHKFHQKHYTWHVRQITLMIKFHLLSSGWICIHLSPTTTLPFKSRSTRAQGHEVVQTSVTRICPNKQPSLPPVAAQRRHQHVVLTESSDH